MKSIKFLKTGEKRDLKCDITLFSDMNHNLPGNNCQTIVLQGIERKQCVIIRDEHTIKIMDLASFQTKLCIKDEMINLIPFKFYELRDNDKIYIGDYEMLVCTSDENKFLFVPETQPQDIIENTCDFVEREHIEIPETQPFDTQTDKYVQRVQKHQAPDIKSEFLVETQPLFNVIPRLTRAQAIKQNKIKPKSVPLKEFDMNSMAFDAETQPISYEEVIKKESVKSKGRPQMKTCNNKREMNSILLSEDDLSDTDDERSTRSTVINGIPSIKKSLENDNSLDISIDDEFDIPSQIFDSQFLEKVNESCSEDYSLVLNTDFEEEKKDIKKEDVTKNDESEEDFDDIKPPTRKKFKLFKFNYSDDDD